MEASFNVLNHNSCSPPKLQILNSNRPSVYNGVILVATEAHVSAWGRDPAPAAGLGHSHVVRRSRQRRTDKIQ